MYSGVHDLLISQKRGYFPFLCIPRMYDHCPNSSIILCKMDWFTVPQYIIYHILLFFSYFLHWKHSPDGDIAHGACFFPPSHNEAVYLHNKSIICGTCICLNKFLKRLKMAITIIAFSTTALIICKETSAYVLRWSRDKCLTYRSALYSSYRQEVGDLFIRKIGEGINMGVSPTSSNSIKEPFIRRVEITTHPLTRHTIDLCSNIVGMSNMTNVYQLKKYVNYILWKIRHR